MPYPGEYTNPLPRITNVQETIVSGYATTRLRVAEREYVAVSGHEDNDLQVVLENPGTSATVTVQFKQTDDITATGTRLDVGDPVSLVPGGRKTVNLAPWQEYLEIHGTTDGQIRAMISGKRRWEKMAFAKTDTFYPPQLRNHAPTVL